MREVGALSAHLAKSRCGQVNERATTQNEKVAHTNSLGLFISTSTHGVFVYYTPTDEPGLAGWCWPDLDTTNASVRALDSFLV